MVNHSVLITLGPEGSYSSIAAKNWAEKHGHQVQYGATISAVFEKVEAGEATHGLVPLSNKLKGKVEETHQNLNRGNVKVIEKYTLPIIHHLAVLPGVDPEEIIEVHSHPQALGQCSDYLKRHFPMADQVETSSTAAAFESIKAQGLSQAAAIGSSAAVEAFGFVSVAENIGNEKENETTFGVIER